MSAPSPVMRALSSGFEFAGGLALLVLMLATVIAVVFRYGLAEPIFGIEDVSKLALGVFVGAALFESARKNAHVAVDLIEKALDASARRALASVGAILTATATGLCAWALGSKALCGPDCGLVTSNLHIPLTPIFAWIAFAFAAFCVIQLASIVSIVLGRRQHDAR